MSERLSRLMRKYQEHLKNGEQILRELDNQGRFSGPEYQQQKAINAIWRIVLNDLEFLADNESYESKKE